MAESVFQQWRVDLDFLVNLANALESGAVSSSEAAEAIRTLTASVAPANQRRPGRPKGSKTFRETPAVKYAREFLELQLTGLPPHAAAKKVAALHNIHESTVYKNTSRHAERLLNEAQKAANDADLALGRRVLEKYPESAGQLVKDWQDSIQRIAEGYEAIGDPETAHAVRDKFLLRDEIPMRILAMAWHAILRRKRNTTGD